MAATQALLSSEKTQKKGKKVRFKEDIIFEDDSSCRRNHATIFSTLVVVLSSLEIGYCIGYSSLVDYETVEELGHGTFQICTFSSLLSIGAVVGAVGNSAIADYVGRKGALTTSSASSITGWMITVLTKDPLFLICGRLLLGLGTGISSFTVPIYISEISPKNLRGELVAIHQLFQVMGAVVIYLLGMPAGLHLLAILALVPCFLSLLGLFFIPESPRWLAMTGQDWEFEMALRKLRGEGSNISLEVAEIRDYVQETMIHAKMQLSNLFQLQNAHYMIVGVGLMLLQQLGGFGAIIFYARKIFESKAISLGNMTFLWVASLQVLMTAVSIVLMAKLGRRLLLRVSAGGMSLGCFLIGFSYIILGPPAIVNAMQVCGILVYIAMYSLGMAGIPWLLMSEIFPMHMKAMAGSLVTLISWLGYWIVTMTFSCLLAWNKAGSFFIFGAFSVSTVFFVVKIVPETKGKTLEEIQAAFHHVIRHPYWYY